MRKNFTITGRWRHLLLLALSMVIAPLAVKAQEYKTWQGEYYVVDHEWRNSTFTHWAINRTEENGVRTDVEEHAYTWSGEKSPKDPTWDNKKQIKWSGFYITIDGEDYPVYRGRVTGIEMDAGGTMLPINNFRIIREKAGAGTVQEEMKDIPFRAGNVYLFGFGKSGEDAVYMQDVTFPSEYSSNQTPPAGFGTITEEMIQAHGGKTYKVYFSGAGVTRRTNQNTWLDPTCPTTHVHVSGPSGDLRAWNYASSCTRQTRVGSNPASKTRVFDGKDFRVGELYEYEFVYFGETPTYISFRQDLTKVKFNYSYYNQYGTCPHCGFGNRNIYSEIVYKTDGNGNKVEDYRLSHVHGYCMMEYPDGFHDGAFYRWDGWGNNPEPILNPEITVTDDPVEETLHSMWFIDTNYWFDLQYEPATWTNPFDKKTYNTCGWVGKFVKRTTDGASDFYGANIEGNMRIETMQRNQYGSESEQYYAKPVYMDPRDMRFVKLENGRWYPMYHLYYYLPQGADTEMRINQYYTWRNYRYSGFMPVVDEGIYRYGGRGAVTPIRSLADFTEGVDMVSPKAKEDGSKMFDFDDKPTDTLADGDDGHRTIYVNFGANKIMETKLWNPPYAFAFRRNAQMDPRQHVVGYVPDSYTGEYPTPTFGDYQYVEGLPTWVKTGTPNYKGSLLAKHEMTPVDSVNHPGLYKFEIDNVLDYDDFMCYYYTYSKNPIPKQVSADEYKEYIEKYHNYPGVKCTSAPDYYKPGQPSTSCTLYLTIGDTSYKIAYKGKPTDFKQQRKVKGQTVQITRDQYLNGLNLKELDWTQEQLALVEAALGDDSGAMEGYQKWETNTLDDAGKLVSNHGFIIVKENHYKEIGLESNPFCCEELDRDKMYETLQADYTAYPPRAVYEAYFVMLVEDVTAHEFTSYDAFNYSQYIHDDVDYADGYKMIEAVVGTSATTYWVVGDPETWEDSPMPNYYNITDPSRSHTEMTASRSYYFDPIFWDKYVYDIGEDCFHQSYMTPEDLFKHHKVANVDRPAMFFTGNETVTGDASFDPAKSVEIPNEGGCFFYDFKNMRQGHHASFKISSVNVPAYAKKVNEEIANGYYTSQRGWATFNQGIVGAHKSPDDEDYTQWYAKHVLPGSPTREVRMSTNTTFDYNNYTQYNWRIEVDGDDDEAWEGMLPGDYYLVIDFLPEDNSISLLHFDPHPHPIVKDLDVRQVVIDDEEKAETLHDGHYLPGSEHNVNAMHSELNVAKGRIDVGYTSQQEIDAQRYKVRYTIYIDNKPAYYMSKLTHEGKPEAIEVDYLDMSDEMNIAVRGRYYDLKTQRYFASKLRGEQLADLVDNLAAPKSNVNQAMHIGYATGAEDAPGMVAAAAVEISYAGMTQGVASLPGYKLTALSYDGEELPVAEAILPIIHSNHPIVTNEDTAWTAALGDEDGWWNPDEADWGTHIRRTGSLPIFFDKLCVFEDAEAYFPSHLVATVDLSANYPFLVHNWDNIPAIVIPSEDFGPEETSDAQQMMLRSGEAEDVGAATLPENLDLYKMVTVSKSTPVSVDLDALIPSAVAIPMVDPIAGEHAEYFNLQGQPIVPESAAPGIYIRRQGLHTDKVIIRLR